MSDRPPKDVGDVLGLPDDNDPPFEKFCALVRTQGTVNLYRLAQQSGLSYRQVLEEIAEDEEKRGFLQDALDELRFDILDKMMTGSLSNATAKIILNMIDSGVLIRRQGEGEESWNFEGDS